MTSHKFWKFIYFFFLFLLYIFLENFSLSWNFSLLVHIYSKSFEITGYFWNFITFSNCFLSKLSTIASIKVAIPVETIWTQLYYSKFISFHGHSLNPLIILIYSSCSSKNSFILFISHYKISSLTKSRHSFNNSLIFFQLLFPIINYLLLFQPFTISIQKFTSISILPLFTKLHLIPTSEYVNYPFEIT